jgi:mutator protein MutT
MGSLATQIAIAVVECDDFFLIGQRPAGASLAGLWEFPGGKIEAGETPAAAAVRECREEAGLEVVAVRAYPVQQEAYAHDTVALHFIACRLAGATTADPSSLQPPLAPFRWVKRTDLSAFQFPAGNRGLLALLAAGG